MLLSSFKCLSFFPNPQNFNLIELIASCDFVDDYLPLYDVTENRVFSIEMGSGKVSDEELTPIGSRASVGHG